jgi:hypothetical protein
MSAALMKRLVQFIKRYPPLYGALRYKVYARYRSVCRRQIFLTVYEGNYWDHGLSASGPGSSLEATEGIRNALPQLVEQLGTKSFLDIPCGDFFWMQNVVLRVQQYIGADIVGPLIERNQTEFGDRGTFLQLDLMKDRLPRVDIIFCRDCFVHLSFRDIRLALNNVKRSASTYLLTTTLPEHKQNVDTVSPYWRALNLELRPFNFPAPIRLLKDFSEGQPNDQGKYLGVWRIKDLHAAADQTR